MSLKATGNSFIVLSIVSGSRVQRQGSLEDYGSSDFLHEGETFEFDEFDQGENFDFDELDSVQSVSTASCDHGKGQETTELYELSLATAHSITSLLKLSIVIRNPAPKDRYANSALATPIDSMYDIGHVWQKYPQARNSPWLINRLGKAITRRREFFQYRERHRKKLSRNIESFEFDNGSEPATERRPDPMASLAGHSRENTHYSFLSSTAPTVSFPPTQASTTENERIVHPEDQSDAGQSETSFAVSISELEENVLRPPPRPKEAADGEPFECPYCFVILVAPSNKSWEYDLPQESVCRSLTDKVCRRHIFTDLNPYVCTFEYCDSRLYSTRHKWFEHELEAHRKDWQCKVNGCGRVFKAVRLLEAHVKTHHADSVTETQLPALLQVCGRPLDRMAPEDCPFCDQWADHLRRTQPINGSQLGHRSLVVTSKQFRDHVSRHMEQLALFALPKHVEDEDYGEADSIEPAAGDALEEDAVEKAIERAGFSAPEGTLRLPLERGANVRSSREDLPLYLAAKQDLEALQKIIEAGVDVSAVGKDGAGAIHQAARDGDCHAVSLLLQMGADVHAKDSSGSTPLHRAADKGQTKVVKLLLDRGVDIDSRDLSGATALRRAAGKGHEQVVELLLENGADVDAIDFRGSTPVHRAAENGHHGTVRLLCSYGAQIDSKDNDGLTPLLHAIQRERHEAVVLYLLSRGANIEAKSLKGVNALQTVSGKGHTAATQLLLKQGAHVDAPGPRNMTSLHRAAYNDHAGVLEVLLDYGADANMRDDDGWTALHGAASAGFLRSTIVLVEKAGHTLEARDNNGLTPLHHAVSQGRRKIIAVLLEHGANAGAETDAGETTLHMAAAEDIREQLRVRFA